MSRPLKIILLALAGFIGVFALISVALLFFIDANAYKPRMEKAASEALRMDVRIGGRIRVVFLPGLRVSLGDVRIRSGEMDVASMKEAGLDIALLPLLSKEVRIKRIRLRGPAITVARDHTGAFHFGAKGASSAMALDHLSVTEGTLVYKDERSGGGFEAEIFNFDAHDLRIAGDSKAGLLKNLSFTAAFACRGFRTKNLLLSDMKLTCTVKDGIFTLNPITAHLFGGHGTGSVVADFSGAVPRYSVRSSLSQFRVEEYFKTFSSKRIAEGSMDFSSSLSMQGDTARELRRTSGGEISLRGRNLTLYGSDLDRQFARFESSQNFNLLDAGAFFLAGPLGLAVTKGYNFASTFQGSGGTSSIGILFSDWKVERGVAQARDAAMATRHNRIALKGRLNFVTEHYEDVTIAVIDAEGCARVKQKVHGPFGKPVVEKPNVVMSLAGPAINLLKEARNLFPGGQCDVFYAGQVAAPK